MYRLEFHHSPQRVLYMYKEIGDDWTDITGSGNCVNLRFDPVSANGVFTSVIKTSLQVQLIRTNEEDYEDIISADDNEWNAVVVENGELVYESGVGYNLSEGANLIFKGLLTLETYGEAYQKFATVNLTFHDRLGYLSEIDFTAVTPKMTLTDILGQCLQGTTCAKHLYMEFPFDVELESVDTLPGYWTNLRSPRNLLLDISEYHLKPKKDLLEDILFAFGWRLYCDFEPIASEDTTPALEDCGVIRMEIVVNCKEANSEYLKFTIEEYIADSNIDDAFYRYVESDDSSEFEQTPTVEARQIILMDTSLYPIMNRSGAWQLVRRAKYIEANNEFLLRDNLLFPDTIEEEDFVFADGSRSGYNLQYNFWGYFDAYNGDMFDRILDYFENHQTLRKAYANVMGTTGKIGVMLRDDLDESPYGILTNSGLVIKDDVNTLRIDLEAWTNIDGTRNVYVSLFAIYKGELYHYFAAGGEEAWVKNPTQYYGFRMQPGFETFSTGYFTAIPQPPTIPVGDPYEICMFVDAGNPTLAIGEVYYLTALKITLESTVSYPKKLQVLTNLSITRRSPVELNPKFYNLPEVEGASGIYDSGIYGKELDMEIDSVLVPAASGIVPLSKLLFGGNNGTLLVHLSDMYGIQHLHDRWEFTASITKGLSGKKFYLSLSTEGEGAITADPDQVNYEQFEQVTLTADATDSLGTVIKWVVNGTETLVTDDSNIATLVLTMDEDKDVRAVFGGVVFYEEFETWGGSYPDEVPTNWTETIFFGASTYDPDTTIHVKPYGSITGIHFYKELNTKGIRLATLLGSDAQFSGKLQVDMPITEASGISIDAFAIQFYHNASLLYQKNYVGTYNQIYEITTTQEITEIRLILSSNGGGGVTANVKIPYLKITKIA